VNHHIRSVVDRVAADHDFRCDERGSYHAESARIAWGRTTAFLEKNMK
jgi:dienelactone hydrolase